MIAGETPLQMAQRHVAEQRIRIHEQHVRIDRLRQLGLPTEISEDLLDRMDDLLESMIADLARLSN